MVRGYTAQTRFVAGELSPRMHMQFQSELYQNGAASIENMIVTQQGTVLRRQGTDFVAEYAGTYARVFPFQLSPDSPAGKPFPIVVSDNGQLYVEGSFASVITAVVNPNPSFDLGSTDWTTSGYGTITFGTGQVDVTASTIEGQDRYIYQALALDAGTYLINFDSYTPDFFGPSIEARVGTTAGGNEIALTYLGPQSYQFVLGAPATVYSGVKIFGGNYLIQDPEVPDGGTQDITVTFFEVRQRITTGSTSSASHNYDTDDIKNLCCVMVPAENAMFFATPKKPPAHLRYDEGTTTWVFEDIVFTGAPLAWATGNYPRCVCFFQGRSFWGGVESDPETVWSSKSLDYRNLTVGPNADDALEFTISAKGRIEWMEGVRNLLIGTEFGEYIVTSQSGVVQPSDLAVVSQSADGGINVKPLAIGSAALFVSADGKKIKTAMYSWSEESWITRDVTAQAEHLFKSGVVEIVHARNPYNLIIVLLESGDVAMATVFSFNETMAWHHHSFSSKIISACVLQEEGNSTVYLVTYRAGGLTLERMSTGECMDSKVTKSSDTEFDTMTGLTNMANKTVWGVFDGFWYDSVAVDGSGNVTLPISCKRAVVGFPCVSSIKPLRKDFQLGAGSTASLKKTAGIVDLWILDSFLPTVNSRTTLTRSTETVINQVEPLVTGMVSYSMNQYNDGDITIKSQGPYALELCGVFNKIEGSTL